MWARGRFIGPSTWSAGQLPSALRTPPDERPSARSAECRCIGTCEGGIDSFERPTAAFAPVLVESLRFGYLHRRRYELIALLPVALSERRGSLVRRTFTPNRLSSHTGLSPKTLLLTSARFSHADWEAGAFARCGLTRVTVKNRGKLGDSRSCGDLGSTIVDVRAKSWLDKPFSSLHSTGNCRTRGRVGKNPRRPVAELILRG